MRNLRTSRDRLISFAAIVAWRIASVAAIAAGLMIALSLALALGGA
jgi:hypothetical protein